MKIAVVNSWKQVRGHWRHVMLWFTYHFVVFILCITNIVFLIVHLGDFTIDVNNSSNILLTIVGFLFAFAGINIYSIFNTNIEAEKSRLDEQANRYENQMLITTEQSRFALSIARLQLVGQLITSTTVLNSQFIEWIFAGKKQVNYLIDYLSRLYDSGNHRKFEELYADVLFLERGLLCQLMPFSETISKSRYFFQGQSSAKQNQAIEELKSLINVVKAIENYDFFQKRELIDSEDRESPPIKLQLRVAGWWMATKAVFSPKNNRIHIIKEQE